MSTLTFWKSLPHVIHRRSRYARLRGKRYIVGVLFGKELADLPIGEYNSDTKKFQDIENARGNKYGFRNSLINVKKNQRHSKKKSLRKQIKV